MLPVLVATTRIRARQCGEGIKNSICNSRNFTPLSSSLSSVFSPTETNTPQKQQVRHYFPNYYGASKARPKLTYTVDEAIKLLREQCSSNPKSMVSTQLTMNLDWRIKTQRLEGVYDMPYSTGKLQSVAAATLDLDLAEEALKAGANHAGDLTARILSNEIQWPKQFQVVVCTPELAHEMTGKTKLGRKLKRHKITPTTELKTIVEPEEFCETVRKHAYGFYIPYKSDMHGNISTKLARFSELDEIIIENFHYVLRHMFDTQLTQFGNGPDAKKKNIGKYILGIHIVASQADAFTLNLDSIDICRELNQQTINIVPGKRWKMKRVTN
jgi:large subunit ribosomal protein L1